MKNKLREKIIASLMLLVFGLTNTTAVIAAQTSIPNVRTQQAVTSLDINSEVQLPNGDSLVNLSLRDADIKQVFRMFADQAGMNIIFASSVEGTVTMDLVNISLSKAMDLVMATNNLTYRVKSNTLIISSKDDEFDLGGVEKDIIIIPVKYVSAIPIADFLNKNIFSKNGINPGVSTKPVATVNSALNELMIIGTREDAMIAQKIVDQFDKMPAVNIFKVNHVTPAEMAALLCSTFLPSLIGGDSGTSTGGAAGIPTGFASDMDGDSGDGGGSSFGSSSSSSSSGGSGNGVSIGGGVVACTLEHKVDAEDIQSFSLKNMTITYFPTMGTIQVLGGSESQIQMIKDYIAANDQKSQQAYLEIQIISLSEQGSKQFDNTWQFMSKHLSFNAGDGIHTASSGGGMNYPIFFAGKGFSEQAKGTAGSSTTKDDTGDVKYARWSGSPQLIWTINYLVENSKGRVLANPRILITNGQQSTIDLTSDYVSKVTSQYLDSTGTGSSQVQKDYDIQKDNGIKVSITPFISPDGYVTLDIKPEYATIASQLYSGSEVQGQNDLAATLLQRRNLDLKGIRIKDGETLIIGGMIQEYETKTVKKIPFLGDLPVVGMIFRSTDVQKQKEEMVIMITPQILVDTEDAKEDVTL